MGNETLTTFQAELAKLNSKTAKLALDPNGNFCETWDKVKPYISLAIKFNVFGDAATKQFKILRTALNSECKA